MTTIAYTDNIIAYDSRMTKGSTIIDDNYNKHFIKNNIHFFISGSVDKIPDIINAWFEKDYNKDICPTNTVLVWDGITLWEFGLYKNGRVSKVKASLHIPCALGSGEDYAYTAMDCGLSAKEAVKMSIKRDTNTGGRIRTFKLR